MTGAPKKRSVEMLEALEDGQPRGIYSGALGFVSIGRQRASDFAVVIRTAVWHGNKVSVGAGGAVTVLSDPTEEENEMRVKLSSVLPHLFDPFEI